MYQIFFYLLYFLQHFLNFFKLPHGHLSLGFGLFVLTFGFRLHSVLVWEAVHTQNNVTRRALHYKFTRSAVRICTFRIGVAASTNPR